MSVLGGHSYVSFASSVELLTETPAADPEPPSKDINDYATVEEAATRLGLKRAMVQRLVGWWLNGVGDDPPRTRGVASYRVSVVLGLPTGVLGEGRQRRMIYKPDLETAPDLEKYRRAKDSEP